MLRIPLLPTGTLNLGGWVLAGPPPPLAAQKEAWSVCSCTHAPFIHVLLRKCQLMNQPDLWTDAVAEADIREPTASDGQDRGSGSQEGSREHLFHPVSEEKSGNLIQTSTPQKSKIPVVFLTNQSVL